ncbi:proteic killer suppression protein [Paraburkholderia caballeronis]|uniref:type II toxin-antitoxin system RelE/ParE family toxin n=1 Tax=Paraburkholderia caballeronis TaxID=416943 RepID=UPI00106477C1|nr:type II toxin-antitoxin system RelE/ParE family toxin [Paraburkholderia caballeronis]TDV25064.1 proteic killer suppression protein [Paraburkholderia caballeronis]
MISSFACRDTAALFAGRRIARFVQIETAAIRKLQQLNAAATLSFLAVPPGNRLERLDGDRAGRYSLRINARWRICFRFEDGDVTEVEIVDYH